MKKPNTNGAATTRKLKLARETLRQLSTSELTVANGGYTEEGCTTQYPCRPPEGI